MAKKWYVNGEITQSIGHRSNIYSAGQEFPVDDIDKSALDSLIAGKYIIETTVEMKPIRKVVEKIVIVEAKSMSNDTGEIQYKKMDVAEGAKG